MSPRIPVRELPSFINVEFYLFLFILYEFCEFRNCMRSWAPLAFILFCFWIWLADCISFLLGSLIVCFWLLIWTLFWDIWRISVLEFVWIGWVLPFSIFATRTVFLELLLISFYAAFLRTFELLKSLIKFCDLSKSWFTIESVFLSKFNAL
jgi:hypothetical protein